MSDLYSIQEKIDECDDHFKSALMKRKKIKEITYHVYVDVLRLD